MAPTRLTDRFAAARGVADAVLYEGYVLYPYRASARKNQVRWQFGVLAPRPQAELAGSERWSMGTTCVVDPGASPTVHVRLRCLQLAHRTIEAAAGGGFQPVDVLDVDGARWVAWDDAVEHDVAVAELALLPVAAAHIEVPVDLPGGLDVEELRAGGDVVGRAVRKRQPVAGRVRVETSWAAGPGAFLAVAVTIENVTDWCAPEATRDEVMRRSLVAVHIMLAVDDGRFVSLLDPPPAAAEAVAGCANDGAFPVLVGSSDDLVLASPIILYDHPEIAPESTGDLCDATEIDEILALRVLTLTDDEKAEARGTDPRAAEIVARCDDMAPEAWARLHGTIRAIAPAEQASAEPDVWWDPAAEALVDPWSETAVVGVGTVSAGSKVVLRPGHRRADAHDLFLAGMAATVAGVFKDAEGELHLAVTVDDDPANEALSWQGRYLFFRPDEVELVEADGVKVLVAGIGNIFFGDDGFGVEVAARLAERSWPPGTSVADYGIRGVHLAYELLDGYDVLVLVDAVPMGERPGTLAVIDVDPHDRPPSTVPLDAHTMTPAVVLGTLDRLGGHIDRVLVIGCEPAVITPRTGLSPSVAAAVPMAVDLVAEVLDDVLAPAGKEPR